MQLKCRECGANLREGNPGPLCSPCQEKRLKSVADTDRRYYTVEELQYILDLESEESVKRLGRKGIIPGRMPGIKKHLYLKESVDAWIKAGNNVVRKPTSPIQAEAYALCIRGDHTWMRDVRFKDQAYQEEHTSEISDRQSIVMSYIRTCYFCGHIEVVPFF
jgi:hypothetical protein